MIMEHSTPVYSSRGSSPDVIEDSHSARSSPAVSVSSRTSPIDTPASQQVYRPEPIRVDHHSRSGSPTPGNVTQLSNNNNNNEQRHQKNTLTKPSFMINDILSDKHPVKSRSPPQISSPTFPTTFPDSSTSPNPVTAALMLGHHQQRLMASLSPRSQHRTPTSGSEFRSHMNGHFPLSAVLEQQQLNYAALHRRHLLGETATLPGSLPGNIHNSPSDFSVSSDLLRTGSKRRLSCDDINVDDDDDLLADSQRDGKNNIYFNIIYLLFNPRNIIYCLKKWQFKTLSMQ